MNKKKVTFADIAEYTGLSKATVSRSISHKGMVKTQTQQKVIEAMKALGYDQQEIDDQDSRSDLIIMNIPTLENTFYNDVAKGIKASADSHKYNLLINMEEVNEETIQNILETVKKRGPEGMIFVNHVEARFLNQISKYTKVMQCCEYCEDSEFSFVSIDDYVAARNAVDHIISTGHTEIAFMNGNPNTKYGRDRLRGFVDSMKEAGLPVVNEWILQSSSISFDTAFALASQLLNSKERPNAFFAAADTYASAIIKVAQGLGLRVPQDIVVVGFDNLDIAKMTTPPITTVSQPRYQQGFIAAEVLFDMIQTGNHTQRKIYLDTELVVRQSSLVSTAENGNG